VLLELISLNLAWMLVLSIHMSVLVATLMAFGKMSADNEITIMRASGMSLYRMMLPVVLAAALITVGLTWFNNAVLPEANIRLQVLMTDIVRIKPTLSLQAGVFTSENDLPNYRILVRKTHEKSNDLEGVTIYDLSDPKKNVVVTAHHGRVSFSEDYSTILMDLHDGEIHEMETGSTRQYRRLRFTRHRVAIPASGFGFERSSAENARRDDRTMSAAMMRAIVDSIRANQHGKVEQLSARMSDHLRRLFDGRPEYFSGAPSRAMAQVARTIRPDTLFPEPEQLDTLSIDTLRAAADSLSFSSVDSLQAAYRTITDMRQLQRKALAEVGSIRFDDRQKDRYLVEIYKKYSIPVACLIFVLIGAPLGTMARRGGFGMGAGLSLGFFLFYWACLIGGEKLADRDVLSPFWGMWVANFVLGILGIILTIRIAKESTVIDWTSLARFLPKAMRSAQSDPNANPHEA
jgi:lipopolysaccharide export system permease protein